jgi:TetR/AcrR family transcriptional regulator, repressor for neighboring sulfatase
MAPTSRVRRPAADSKARILDAAERLLIEGGPMAVQVRAVATLVGMTDAGVSHHFGTRDELLVALLHHGSRRLRGAVDDVVRSWVDDSGAVEALVQSIAALYRNRYGELAIALHSAGWRNEGKGMLDPVVKALHAARTSRDKGASLMDTCLAVAALHQALAIDPVYGASFRRSAGIAGSTAQRADPQLEWWTKTLIQVLGLQSP